MPLFEKLLIGISITNFEHKIEVKSIKFTLTYKNYKNFKLV